MNEKPFDAAIAGAGPAGATAATVLAQKGRRVVLVDRETFPRPARCSGWVGQGAVSLLSQLGATDLPWLGTNIRDVALYNSDLTKCAIPKLSEPAGLLVDREAFDHGLIQLAAESGVTVVQGCAIDGIRLHESSVTMELVNGRRLDSKLLVVALGRQSSLFESVGFSPESVESSSWTVQVVGHVSSGPAAPQVGVILGLDEGRSFGMSCRFGKRVTLDVNWFGDRASAVDALRKLCRLAKDHSLIPIDLSDQVDRAEVFHRPAPAAMDIESHVRKHTLLIGDSGRFMSAASNEGIYPAMWSAKIAAEVAHAALDNAHTQDGLMLFDSAWRLEMGDYLRLPHTDVRFLLPLIFTNQPMADRMGAAFFHGTNI